MCYVQGAFDVFLASNHLPLPLHRCIEYGSAFYTEWYCDGEWSTNPFTPEVQAHRSNRAKVTSGKSSRGMTR